MLEYGGVWWVMYSMYDGDLGNWWWWGGGVDSRLQPRTPFSSMGNPARLAGARCHSVGVAAAEE